MPRHHVRDLVPHTGSTLSYTTADHSPDPHKPMSWLIICSACDRLGMPARHRYLTEEAAIAGWGEHIAWHVSSVDEISFVGFQLRRCAVCDVPFTTAAWSERHTGPDGTDVHEGCCQLCTGESE